MARKRKGITIIVAPGDNDNYTMISKTDTYRFVHPEMPNNHQMIFSRIMQMALTYKLIHGMSPVHVEINDERLLETFGVCQHKFVIR